MMPVIVASKNSPTDLTLRVRAAVQIPEITRSGTHANFQTIRSTNVDAGADSI
jgi:hypothetical protein